MKKALDVGCSLLVAVVAMAGAVAETPQETFGLRPKRIACIGDSITYGYLLEHRDEEGYPRQLQLLLDGVEKGAYEVRNFGNPGRGVYLDTLRGSEKRGFRWMKEHQEALAWKPDVVISNLGINDIFEYAKEFDGGRERGQFRKEYELLLGDYARLETKPRLFIWTKLSALTPVHSAYNHPQLPEMQSDLSVVAKKMSAVEIDMLAPFGNNAAPLLLQDGIHPNAAGAKLIARQTFGILGGGEARSAVATATVGTVAETSQACVSEIGRGLAPDVFIGTAGLGHVTPAAAYPFGMVQAGPDTSDKEGEFVADWAHTSGYQYGDRWLWRFSQTHLSGTGCSSFGDFGLLPFIDGFDGAAKPAKMLKNAEKGEPGFYAVTLEEDGRRIVCEVSALAHSAAYRFTYPKGKMAKLLLDLDCGIGAVMKKGCWGKRVDACDCAFLTDWSVRGGRRMWNWNDYELHFSMEFSAPMVSRRKLREADGVRGEIYELDFGELTESVLEVRLGLSFTSSEAAARNLAKEMPRFDFDAVRAKSAADWRTALSRVELGADTPADVAANFRAALYRTMFQPNLISDVGEPPRYSTFSLWDTFRAAHPLYTLVAPERIADFVNAMLEQHDRQGYLPIWAMGGNDNHCMIGHHAVPVIADAFLKGVTGVDWELAFAAIRNSLTINHKAANEGTWGLVKEDWDILDKYGYYPFDLMRGEYDGQKVKGESVARLLECAYDDACAARMAERLGKTSDAAFFRKRATNWRNVFDSASGFMRGKDSKGKWREPFDPYALGMGPWRENDFCEGNSWQYTWHVMQDMDGLVAAIGGKAEALRRLDRLFTERPPDQAKDGDAHDVSGAIGQYVHGNEPSHHIAYAYSLLGRSDRTADVVRQIFDKRYSPSTDGLCGNDDCGQMAAWYLFSAMGFYPFDPCGGEYVIGAPQLPKVTIHYTPSPSDSTSFTVVAKGLSKENKYVKSVMLNGKPITDWKIRHAEIVKGGELVFEMRGEK